MGSDNQLSSLQEDYRWTLYLATLSQDSDVVPVSGAAPRPTGLISQKRLMGAMTVGACPGSVI